MTRKVDMMRWFCRIFGHRERKGHLIADPGGIRIGMIYTCRMCGRYRETQSVKDAYDAWDYANWD